MMSVSMHMKRYHWSAVKQRGGGEGTQNSLALWQPILPKDSCDDVLFFVTVPFVPFPLSLSPLDRYLLYFVPVRVS